MLKNAIIIFLMTSMMATISKCENNASAAVTTPLASTPTQQATTCKDNEWLNSDGICFECKYLIPHCESCDLAGTCFSCAYYYKLQSKTSNTGKVLQFCDRLKFFRTWAGVLTIAIGTIFVGVVVGFIIYLSCKNEDRYKRWKKFNKVNPLRRMRMRLFSVGANVLKFKSKRKNANKNVVETLGTQGDELNFSSRNELKYNPPGEDTSKFDSVESTYDPYNKRYSEASAVMSRRMASQQTNRFAFAFADFSNWQPSPVARRRQKKRREDRTSLHVVQNRTDHMRRVSHFGRMSIKNVIVEPSNNNLDSSVNLDEEYRPSSINRMSALERNFIGIIQPLQEAEKEKKKNNKRIEEQFLEDAESSVNQEERMSTVNSLDYRNVSSENNESKNI